MNNRLVSTNIHTVFILLFFCCFSHFLNGQNNQLKTCKNQKEKLSHYNQLFWQYIYKIPDSAFFYAREGFSETSKEDDGHKSMFLNNIGIYYYFTDRFDSARTYYNKALHCAQSGNDSTQCAKIENNLGIIEDIQGNYEEAIDHYGQALLLHTKMKNFQQVAECMNNIAVVYKEKGELGKALRAHLQSTAILDSIGNEEGLAFNYNNIGLIKDDLGEYKEAISYYNKALSCYKKLEIPIEQASVLLNLANVYHSQGLHDLAIDYYQQAIDIYEDKKQPSGVGICLINIAKLQHQNKEEENARKNLNESIELFKQIGYKEKYFDATINLASLEIYSSQPGLADSLLNVAMQLAKQMDVPGNIAIANFYKGQLAFKQEQYKKAHQYYTKALDLYSQTGQQNNEGKALLMIAKCQQKQNKKAEAINLAKKAQQKGAVAGDVFLQKECAQFLTKQYKKQADYKQYSSYLRQYNELKDSLINIENVRKVTAFQLKTEHKEKMAAQKMLAEKEQFKLTSEVKFQKRIRNILFLSSLLLLTSAIIISFLYRKRHMAYNMLVQKNEELVRAYSQLTQKNQKNPKQQKIKLTDDKRKLLLKIKFYLEDEKKFLSPKLKVSDMSKDLETNSSYISQIINNEYGKNFNHFINDLRVQEACKLFHKGRYRENTIEAIAQMTGFNNRATFISAFKKYTGITPSFYIKSIEKKQGIPQMEELA